jgi:molecular chaperone HscA
MFNMLLQLTDPKDIKQNQDMSQSYAIGIDLGTTHSVVAFARSETAIDVLMIDDSPLVPSLVAYTNNIPVVGKKAASMAHSFSSFKRNMDNPAATLRNDKSPVELSAEILKKLKHEAEAILKKPVTQAVITVPAYFDDTARQATKDAAALAGLEVLRLISEPTAAAFAYGLDQQALNEQTEGTYAIYDLGGGTFDFSILKMKKGVFQVLGTGGDIRLGGDDIDQAIVNHWGKSDELSSSEILKSARHAKEELTLSTTWSEGDLKLTRAQLEEISKSIIDKTVRITKRVMHDIDLLIEDIKGVVLVGGATRMPLVKSAVAEAFKQTPLTNLDPDQVVARGAALQAYALTHGHGTLLLDVTPLSLGIETMGGLTEKLITRNTPIPTRVIEEFTTYENNQTAIVIHIVQGERELVADCRSLSRFVLTDIPPKPAGVTRISVTFQLDADGLLSVEAIEKTTQKKQTIHVKPSYGLSEEQLRDMLIESQANGLDDIKKRQLIETKVDAERLIRYCKSAIDEDGFLLTEDERKDLNKALLDVESSLKIDDREFIRKQMEQLKTATASFAAARMNAAIQKKLIGNKI